MVKVPSINPRTDECQPFDVWPLGTLQYAPALGKKSAENSWVKLRRMLVRIIMAGNLSAFVYISRSVWEKLPVLRAGICARQTFVCQHISSFFFPLIPFSANWELDLLICRHSIFVWGEGGNETLNRKPQMISAVVRDFRLD